MPPINLLIPTKPELYFTLTSQIEYINNSFSLWEEGIQDYCNSLPSVFMFYLWSVIFVNQRPSDANQFRYIDS